MMKRKQTVETLEQAPLPAPKRRCVLILGMHRSATSALTRTLSFMGADLPSVMLGANEGNEAGHWEPERLIAYNDGLLAELHSAWHDWRPLDMTRLKISRREQIKADISNLIEADYPGSALFVVKEPRICRFAGLFIGALQEADIDVRPVIAFRNPLEVVSSLQRRASIWPATHSAGDAALLWLSHILEAEHASRGMQRAVVSYEGLLENWRYTVSSISKQADIDFPATVKEAAPLVGSFLSSDLRHHERSPGDVALDPVLGGWVSEAYEALIQLTANPSAAHAQSVLDRIYREFRHSLPILQNLLSKANERATQAAAELAARDQQLNELRIRAEHAEQRLHAVTTEELQSREQRIGDLVAKLGEVENTLTQHISELVASRNECERLSSEGRQLAEEREQVAHMLEEERALLSQARVLLGAHAGDNRSLDQLVSEWLSKTEGQENELRATQARLDAIEREFAAKDQRIVQLEQAHGEAEEVRQALASQRTQLEQQAADHERLIENLNAEKEAHRARGDALDAERSRAQVEQKRMQEILDAIHASTSWRLTAPIRSIKRTTSQLGTATRTAFGLIRDGRMDMHTVRRSVKRLPALLRQGKLTNPADFASLVETLAPDDVARVVGAFDTEYYLANNPDVAKSRMDPLSHFMLHGWKEHRNPSADFSVSYYMTRYPDIARAGINPFLHYVLHGQREKRSPLPYRARLQRLDFQPKVTAIVPNYNHARFLDQRIRSILEQTYANLDLVILDDCSSDDSRSVIEKWRSQHPSRIKVIFNEENSGNVFRQWRKGLEAANGDLVWVCESDDFCEPDFVEKLIPYFRDRSVQIAFGRIQFSDKGGRFQAGLDQYREGAETGIWNEPIQRPAREWFTKAFGVNNVIANVGGCIWRRQTLHENVWREAEQFSVVGDWFLYCHLAGGGQIAYEPSAVAYFRQHGQNTSVTSFSKAPYYEEHHRLMKLLRRTWGVPQETVERFLSKVEFQYLHFKVEKTLGPLSRFIDKERLLSTGRDRPHILMAFLGFHSGGGEVFPINLANALHDEGYLVSMMALDMSHVVPEMLSTLNPGIPVYDAAWVAEIGADRFLAEAGISLIHSHMISLEFFFFKECRIKTPIPYLVSLHGSYDSGTIDGAILAQFADRVTHWIYTADKNLEPFRSLSLPQSRFSKLGNGMPIDLRPFPQTREELGISSDTTVFTLVARGILRKGWRASITAFIQLRERHPEAKLHLLLCGDGEQAERQRKMHEQDSNITFLGYQSRIPGLYRLSDVAIVPTRFAGESFPLCVIQALQTGTPVISTRVGEIASMVDPPGSAPAAGILLDPVRDTDKFTNSLMEAMEVMLSSPNREKFSAAARELAAQYDIGKVAQDYAGLYPRLLAENSSSGVDKSLS